MSFSARLVHSLTHVRVPRDIDDLDEYGQPTEGTAVETAVRGLVQPRNVREMQDSRSAGVDIGDHVIFLAPMDLDSSDHFIHDGTRYDIRGIRDFAFGRTPHLEVDAQRIGGTP
jgi:hypothetical protein